jgi:CBS domain-containing protein
MPVASDQPRSIFSPLARAVRRTPLVCDERTSVREAIERIVRTNSTAVVVTEAASGRTLGLLGQRELLDRVALHGCPLDQAIGHLALPEPLTLDPRSTAFEAAIAMARSGQHVALVVENDRLIGLVAEDDVLNPHGGSMRDIAHEIRIAPDTATLAACVREIRTLTSAMLTEGASVEMLTQIASTLNDLVAMRVIDLTRPQFEVPDVPMCWIALGSEGRFEQTISSDQDNGLIFEAADENEAERLRAALLPFARAVNQGLDACGFPLCTGDIMAGNPQWCLSFEEWKQKFCNWVMEPVPEALLNSTIFFDFRALWGAEQLALRLRRWLIEFTPDASLFLRHMAGNALTCPPPLGRIRDFTFDDRDKQFPRTINLKMYGSRPFVDAARVFALAHGLAQTSTAERLRAAAPHLKMEQSETAAAIAGFEVIQTLRLRRQIGADVPPGGANRIDPYALNEMDRQMLKQAFKQVQRLQTRLALTYRF